MNYSSISPNTKNTNEIIKSKILIVLNILDFEIYKPVIPNTKLNIKPIIYFSSIFQTFRNENKLIPGNLLPGEFMKVCSQEVRE